MSITQQSSTPPLASAPIHRPLEDMALSQLIQEIEADYNEGRQIRFDVISELILRAGANTH